MARPLRIEFAHALYHVTSRGNARQKVFRDDRDYQRRLDWLRRTVETYGWRVHAFAMMPNHGHLFVETPLANLSAGMHYLNGSYTSYFNRRNKPGDSPGGSRGRRFRLGTMPSPSTAT